MNIIVIGVGKLGSRHLQALAKLNIESSIYVVDPSSDSRGLAKRLYEEVDIVNQSQRISFYERIADIGPIEFDFAIVSTTSDYRYQAVVDLLNNSTVRYMVLEKFLFQKPDEYEKMATLLEEKGVATWVNCPRRMWPVYQELKSLLSEERILDVNVYGQDWSIATSSVHFIDLIAFLCGKTKNEIVELDFGNKFVPAYSSVTGARESRFIEFYGVLRGKFEGMPSFTFTCIEQIKAPLTIQIITSDRVISIFEEYGKITWSCFQDNGQVIDESNQFTMPYQSELTHKVLEDIINNGHSKLTTLDESMELHIPILNSFIQYLSDIKDEKLDYCPIT